MYVCVCVVVVVVVVAYNYTHAIRDMRLKLKEFIMVLCE